MNCLRSGYCCFHYNVTIVIDPSKGPVEDNLRMKKVGERCPHLVGNEPGEFFCSVHNEDWYKDTACFSYSQVEPFNQDCRIGRHVFNTLNKKTTL